MLFIFWEWRISAQNPNCSLLSGQEILITRYRNLAWIDGNVPSFFFDKSTYFVQKIIVADGGHMYVFGDIHADADALKTAFAQLQNDKILQSDLSLVNPNDVFVFLGDYTDRGPKGIEVWDDLSNFLVKNPKNVFLLRGNHEDLDINKEYGFYDEIIQRFEAQDSSEFITSLNVMYNLLPAALFCEYRKVDGSKGYIVCCHGNIEFGYNPVKLLQSAGSVGENIQVDLRTNLACLIKTYHAKVDESIDELIAHSSNLVNARQFIWGRLDFVMEESFFDGSGFHYVPHFFDAVIQQWQASEKGGYSIDGVLRGHDHAIGTRRSKHGIYRANLKIPLYTIISTCPDGVTPSEFQRYKVSWLGIDPCQNVFTEYWLSCNGQMNFCSSIQ